MPVRVIGRIAPFTDGAFKVVNAGDLGGVFIKSVTAGGLVTYQDASSAEQTVQLSLGGGGGGSFSAGTADPTGGAAGDAYLQVDASDVLQSVWLNESGTWAEYTLPAGGTGVTLSDTAPRSVSTGANTAGTATDASRRDHHHQVPAATTTQAGISEHATAAETRVGTSTTRVPSVSALTAGLDNRASDDTPLVAASTATAGSSTDFSRKDHVHPEGPGGTGVALSDDDPESITTGASTEGTSDEASRADHHHHVSIASTTAHGVTQLGTNAQALDSSIQNRAITPHSLDHALDDRASDDDPESSGTVAAGSSADFSRKDHVHPAGAGEGADLSDDLPVNIGPQSQQGTGDEASRDDHTHYLPHDSTLAFSAGALGVSIHDVVEHLSQRIQYYTNENNYDTDGSGAGQVYNSSRYPKNLQWVKAFIRVPLGVDDAIYRAGVYRVASDNEILEVLGQSEPTDIITVTGTYRFDFLAEVTSALGIPLEGGERIMVLIRRVGAGNTAETGLRHGSEDDDSPNASYPDAAVDFVLANHVIVQHENPTVGQTTHSHGGGIRGNLQLGYIVIIDHGSLVGDERNVNVAHIDSGAALDDEFLGNDGAGNALWKVPPSGGAGGGSDPETLFDNHPALVQIGTLSANLTSTPTSLTLAALPTETVELSPTSC